MFLVLNGTIICCNYFYISVKWPLASILIRIKAHLLKDKQISSVRVFDEAKSVTLSRGHLSPKSWLFDQILPQIVLFFILGTLEKKSGKGSIFDIFGAKSEEKGKVSKIKLEIVPDGVTLCMWRCHVLENMWIWSLHETRQKVFGT